MAIEQILTVNSQTWLPEHENKQTKQQQHIIWCKAPADVLKINVLNQRPRRLQGASPPDHACITNTSRTSAALKVFRPWGLLRTLDFFRHYFKVCEKKSEKMLYYNILSILSSIPSILCFVFMLDVLVFVKWRKLVRYTGCIVLTEGIFSSYSITCRPAIYLCLRPEIS